MEYKDYYKTLAVPRTATQADIKKAFRKLARQHHPDRNPGDTVAERRFKDVNEANEVLSDPEKRKRYDALGADWEAYARAGASRGAAGADPFGPGGPFAAYAAGGPGGTGGVRYEFHTTGDPGEFSDFFQAFFGGMAAGGAAAGGRGRSRAGSSAAGPGFGDILSDFGLGGSGGARSGRSRGATNGGASPRPPGAVEAEAEITLEEAANGTTRLVQVDGRRLEVSIPKGVDTGSRVRLSGQGPDGRDLVVLVRVKPHAVFTRSGRDLERELPVTLREALLGADVPVSTLRGRVLLTIPPGTQNGRRIRLAGQGMPALKGDLRGDLYVRTRVILPASLSTEAKEAATRFLDLADQPDPRA